MINMFLSIFSIIDQILTGADHIHCLMGMWQNHLKARLETRDNQ
jgi:hypothetical protein